VISLAARNNVDYIFPEWEYNKYLDNKIPVGDIKCNFIHKESKFSYDEITIDSSKNIDLEGYFQSEKYFVDVVDDIKWYFTLDTTYENHISEKYPILITDKTCSIHVRRGDYINKSDYHPLQTLEYYNNAISELYEDVDNITFLIFSDDIQWCKDNFNLDSQIFIEGNDDIIDMFIMSKCDDNIISNSSFSWWASWLNKNDNRTVCPSEWFGKSGPQDYQDIFNKKWIKL